jgi:hypothetical protein
MVVDAPFDLAAVVLPFGTRLALDGAEPDLVVEVARRSWNDEFPEGRIVAEQQAGDFFYRLVAHGAGFTFAFSRTAVFDLSADLRHVTARPHDGNSEDRLPLFMSGAVIAALLMLRGHAVLHASCVEYDGVATAFVGDSGAGKSTVAAMLCASGARLVTDDVLRVDHSGGARCHAGATSLRLRQGSRLVTSPSLDGEPTDLSVDGRVLWRPPQASPGPIALAEVCELVVDPSITAPVKTTSDWKAGLQCLLRYPRVGNWRDATSAAHFDTLVDVARSVRVTQLRVPLGLPAVAGGAEQLASVVFAR